MSTAAPATQRVLAQARHETGTLLRNGEQLLVALVLPVAVLVGAVHATAVELGDGRRVDLAVPGVLALCVISSAFTVPASSSPPSSSPGTDSCVRQRFQAARFFDIMQVLL